MNVPRTLRAALAAALLAAPAAAADLYVDALAGSDASTGRSWREAWRTLTHALAHLPASYPHVIHVAPGVHDAALGEVFPLAVPTSVTIVGEGGRVVLDGGGAEVALVRWIGVGPFGLLGTTAFESLWLRGARTGMLGALEGDRSYRATLRDVWITDMSARGLDVRTAFDQLDSERVLVLVEGGRVARCAEVGLRVEDASSAAASFAGVVLTCAGTEVDGNAVGALALKSATATGTAHVLLRRARLHDNGTGAAALGRGSVSAHDSLVVANGSGLVDASAAGSTISGNALVGLRWSAGYAPSGGWTPYLHGSIVFGNGDDVRSERASVDARWSDVGDGDFAGRNGCFSADPLFVDAAGGDFRPRLGSPCVDAGEPGAPPGVDLLGTPRPLDGDLDLRARADVGAYELALLRQRGVARVGGTLELELWGPEGAPVTVFFARVPPLDPPPPTPAGPLEIERSRAKPLGTFAAGAGPPALVRLAVPGDPALAGSCVTLQALLRTSGAPAFVLSKAVVVEIRP